MYVSKVPGWEAVYCLNFMMMMMMMVVMMTMNNIEDVCII